MVSCITRITKSQSSSVLSLSSNHPIWSKTALRTIKQPESILFPSNIFFNVAFLGSEKIAIVASYVYSLSHDLNGNLKPELAEAAKANASSDKIIKIADIIGKPEHIDKGREIFKQNCTSCHGPEAKGLVGPNLTDNTWIHGGKPEDIQNTITKGVAAKGMPTWGPILGNEKVADVATFIYSLSHK